MTPQDVAQAGVPPITLLTHGNADSEADGSVYTFAGCDIGSAHVGRKVVVAIMGNAAAAQEGVSVKVNGVDLIRVIDNFAAATRVVEFWAGAVPTGSGGVDIEVTCSGTMARLAAQYWTFQSTQSAPSAVSGTSVTTNTFSDFISIPAVIVPAGGIAFAASIQSTATTKFSWSQTTGAGSTRFNDKLGTTGVYASAYDTTEAGSQIFTADAADNVAYRGGAISWGP